MALLDLQGMEARDARGGGDDGQKSVLSLLACF